ncbi:MAG TPA: DUF192 domain-containing protein [Rhizobiaceae bacterium]|nr:DUF192 domain-containing protein [Rhizobiaceae bacterium]
MTEKKQWLTALAALAAALGIVYFAFGLSSSAQGQAMILPVDPAPLLAVTDGGEKSFTIEVADDPAERSAGLMFREEMDNDHGMLFVFEDTRQVGFWMKNTPMPLDLLFIAPGGEVKAILPGEPFSEAVITPGEPVRFVLELKRGTAKASGIEQGDMLRHPAIERAGNG